MREQEKNNAIIHTLVVVGNGFDLAHGYKTRYQDFLNQCSDECKPFFKLLKCVYNKDDIKEIDSWYDLELQIRELTLIIHAGKRDMSDWFSCLSCSNWDDLPLRLEAVFKSLTQALSDYLIFETQEKKMLLGLEHVFNDYSLVLNFNYTNTVEHYTDSHMIKYVHGQLSKKDIILGYDTHSSTTMNDQFGEPCVMESGFVHRNKEIQRAVLDYKRYLEKSHCDGDFSVNQYEEYLCDQATNHSGVERITLPSFFKDIGQDSLFFPYSDIESIVVMGHGLASDERYLTQVFSRCNNVKSIVIYTYDGEGSQSINDKISFMKRKTKCDQVITRKYGEVC